MERLTQINEAKSEKVRLKVKSAFPPTLEHTLKSGSRKLSSPYIFMTGVQQSSPHHASPSTVPKTRVLPSLPHGVGGRDIGFHRFITSVQDLGTSSFLYFSSTNVFTRDRLAHNCLSLSHLEVNYLFPCLPFFFIFSSLSPSLAMCLSFSI